jgi:hypothetical protein
MNVRDIQHTRRQTLLQLLGFVRILQDEGVEESMASDFELDLLRGLIFFYARRYEFIALAHVCNL